ncbi:MAG: PAS domain S-box protein [Deltaproteobacteria bacterium]|nr:PAS domain S-box protein [Deltaproteobacteria bacterium]
MAYQNSMAKNRLKKSSKSERFLPKSHDRNAINWDQLILGMKKTTKEFVENVLGNIIESIVITNLDGYLVFFNTYSEEMFEFKDREVLNRHIVILGAKTPDVLQHIRKGETFDGEITLKTRSGRYFPAHVRCVPLRDEQERPIAMVGVARDLTKEKEKQRIDYEMKRLETFNENLIDSLNDGIQIIDFTGHMVFVNKRLANLLEYEPEEILGKHYTRVVTTEDRLLFQKLIDSRAASLGKATFETSFISKSGRKIPFCVGSSPLKGGGVSGIVNAVTDISEIQKLKEELFQSEKMSLIGTLAGEVAHEINNPLGGLIISVQMLLEDIEKGELDLKMALEELRGIENDARRCREITRKLLDFSRRMPEERKSLDITKVIEDALILIQRQAEIENISFVKKYVENLPPVWGNSNSLQQVIINLVKNACDAMHGGGQITISTQNSNVGEPEPWVRISIADTGPGIPHDLLDRLFDPFFTTKESGRGTGLGLVVSKRIVEAQGGRLTCENLDGRSGAVFYILLPALKV